MEPDRARRDVAKGERRQHAVEPGQSASRKPIRIQCSLQVGSSNDPAEREADRVANQVVHRITNRTHAIEPIGGPATRVRPAALRAPSSSAGPDCGPAPEGTESRIERSSWHPLEPAVQGRMEDAFGTRFTNVRIHTDRSADELSRDLGAKAFTTGSDVFFREGEYRPDARAGEHLLAHELTHTVQQRDGGAVQRVQRVRDPLTTKEVLAALKGIDFMKTKLKGELHGSTMETRVAEMLRSWKEHIAKKSDMDVDLRDAMMLSMALEGVARVIAEELNDVSILPVVSQKLFDLYRTQIGSKIKGQNRKITGDKQTAVLDLTGALIADDPVTRYLHREISRENAAQSIIAMATKANIPAAQMFDLMEQKFQVKMGSYSQSQLHADDKTERFSARESPGEYSTYYFEQLFGANAFGAGDQAGWTQGGANAADRLAMTTDTEAKLTQLRTAVVNPTAVAAVNPRPGLTDKQERHLSNIEQAEQAINLTTIKSSFVSFFQQRYFLREEAAENLYDRVVAHLDSAPLTITVNAGQWFGGDTAPSPKFKPANARVAKTAVAAAFGKGDGEIEHLPTWNDDGLDESAKRGKKYLRFRAWKDELMSGLNQMEAKEKAVFGALNVNFEQTTGSDSSDMHGSNYYGDMHFVLKREAVRNRMIYTATDHGQHRRNPLLALNDFTFGDRGVTWLQDTKKLGMIDNIVNDVTAKRPLYGLPLLFEVQIFGGVNVKRDVSSVLLGQNVTPELEAKVRKYYKNRKGVVVERAGTAQANAVNTGGTDVDEMLMRELVQSTIVRDDAKTAVNDTVQAATQLMPQQKALLKSVLTMTSYLKQMADQPDRLRGADIATLEAGFGKVTGVSNYLLTMQQMQVSDKDALRRELAAARQTIDAATRALAVAV